MIRKGKEHFNWKGEQVGNRGLHRRLGRLFKKPKKCCFCEQEKKLDLANKNGVYNSEEKNWLWLCRSCHRRYDLGWKIKNGRWFKACRDCKTMLEVTDKNFYKNKNKSVWKNVCKQCYK